MNDKLFFLFIGLLIGSLFGSAITAWIASGSRREKLYQDGIEQERLAMIDSKSHVHLVKEVK